MDEVKKLHSIEEILAIARRDSERFIGICNYYLENDYERFKLILKPMLIKMLNSF